MARRNIGNNANKEDLARLALQKALMVKNIQAGFKAKCIKPLDKDAMVDKMEAHEVFQHPQVPNSDFEDDVMPNQGSQDSNDLRMEEILEEGILSPLRHFTHYYVSFEDDSTIPPNESFVAESTTSQSCSQFLRLPEINVPRPSRIRVVSIINYNNSQVLTSNQHVEKLTRISKKKLGWKKKGLQNKKQRSSPRKGEINKGWRRQFPKIEGLLICKQEKYPNKVGQLQPGVFIIIGATSNMLRPFLKSILAYFMEFFFSRMSLNPLKIV